MIFRILILISLMPGFLRGLCAEENLSVHLKSALKLGCQFSLSEKRERIKDLALYLAEFRSRRLALSENERGYWWSDQEKCRQWLKEFQESDYRPSQMAEALASLDLDDRLQFFLGFFDRGVVKVVTGEQVVVSPTFFIPLRPEISEAEIATMVAAIQKPELGVRWGNAEVHGPQYFSEAFRRQVEVVADILWSESDAAQILKAIQDPQFFWTDTNTIETASRLEPMDLLALAWSHRVRDLVYSSRAWVRPSLELNDVQLLSLMKSALRANAGISQDSRPSGFLPPTGNEILWVCSERASKIEMMDPQSKYIDPQYFSVRPLLRSAPVQVHWIRIEDNLWAKRNSLTMTYACGSHVYKGDLSKRDNSKLELPKLDHRISYANPNDRFVVITMGLTPQMPAELLTALKAHLAGQRWQWIDEKNIELTADVLSSELVQADAVVPIAHAIEPGRLQFGFSQSLLLNFERMDGQTKIHLKIFVPRATIDSKLSNHEIFLDRNNLKKIFQTRFKNSAGRLTAFNMTCRGAQVIPGWMSAFNDFRHENPDAEGLDAQIPLLIGSNAGFRAENLAEYEILASFFDAFVDGLSQDHTEENLMARLNAPVAASLKDRRLDNGFDAVSNFRPPLNAYLIDAKKFDLKLTDTQNPEIKIEL